MEVRLIQDVSSCLANGVFQLCPIPQQELFAFFSEIRKKHTYCCIKMRKYILLVSILHYKHVWKTDKAKSMFSNDVTKEVNVNLKQCILPNQGKVSLYNFNLLSEHSRKVPTLNLHFTKSEKG